MNIPKLNPKQKWLVVGNCIGNLTCSLSFPVMHKLIMENVSERMISLEAILFCITGMFGCCFWEKLREPMMKKYLQFEIGESIMLTGAMIYFFLSFNPVVYYLFDVAYGVMVGQWVGKCSSSFRQFLFPNPKERDNAQNAAEFWCNIFALIGYVTAFIVGNAITPQMALVCFWIGDIVRTFASTFTFSIKYKTQIFETYKKSLEEKKDV